MESPSCSICFEPYNEDDRKPYSIEKCGHCFCLKCILTISKSKEDLPWIKACCPFCNNELKSYYPNYGLIDVLSGANSNRLKVKDVKNEYEKFEESLAEYSSNNMAYKEMIENHHKLAKLEVKKFTEMKLDELKKQEEKLLKTLELSHATSLETYKKNLKAQREFDNQAIKWKSLLNDVSIKQESITDLNSEIIKENSLIQESLNSTKMVNLCELNNGQIISKEIELTKAKQYCDLKFIGLSPLKKDTTNNENKLNLASHVANKDKPIKDAKEVKTRNSIRSSSISVAGAGTVKSKPVLAKSSNIALNANPTVVKNVEEAAAAAKRLTSQANSKPPRFNFRT